MSILDFTISREEFLEQVYNKSNSKNSVTAFKRGLTKWDKYLDSINHKDEAVLKELKGKQDDPDTYRFLNRYVQWLIKEGIARKSIDLHFTVLRAWVSANGVMLFNEYVKRFVQFPKQVKNQKMPLTSEIITRLIEESPKQYKPLLLVLLSSGMRVSEALQIRVKDIDVTTNPISINLRAETTKAREQRTAYISDEAWHLLKPIVKRKTDDQTVFQKAYNNPSSLISAETKFWRLREKCGFTLKYENTNRYHVNIHAFRSYFHTQATKILGGDIAHALIGHHAYLDQYFRLDEKEKSEMYHKLEPYLTVDNTQRTRAIIEDKDRQLEEMDLMKIEMAKMQAQMKRMQDNKN